MKIKKLSRRVGCLCLLLLTLFSGFLVYGVRVSAEEPVVREYSVRDEKISSPVTLVMLSDLHGCEHGEANSELIRLVRECRPDLILMCGDMINGSHETSEDILITAALIRELSELAPVYYSLGNHELARIGIYYDSRLTEFKEAGAAILESEYDDIDIAGNSLRIGGIYTPNGINSKPDISSHLSFFTELCNTERFVLLMEHRPAAFTDQIFPAGFEFDLVLSGHLHGGHAILPFFGPVWGANYGLFPDYALGKYEFGESVLIVSAGLSTARHIVPRINNPTEITKIKLEPLK